MGVCPTRPVSCSCQEGSEHTVLVGNDHVHQGIRKGGRGDKQTPRSCWNGTGVTPKPSWFSLRCSEMVLQERTKSELLRKKAREQADADKGFAEGQWWTHSSVTSGDSCAHHSSAPPIWCLRATERSVSFLRDSLSEVRSVGQQSSGNVGLLTAPLQPQLYKLIRAHCVANYGTAVKKEDSPGSQSTIFGFICIWFSFPACKAGFTILNFIRTYVERIT